MRVWKQNTSVASCRESLFVSTGRWVVWMITTSSGARLRNRSKRESMYVAD